jgi:signal peptidase I
VTLRRALTGVLVALALLAGALLVVGVIASFVVAGGIPLKAYRIPSESMEPTIRLNDRVVVERISIERSDPGRGDIVVFEPPKGADLNACGRSHSARQPCPEPTEDPAQTRFIKRIVAVPGDRLSIRGGLAVVNGEVEDENVARADDECPTCNLEKEITIPPDHYFMMGDNRGASADSREWGPVPKKWIIGRVVATYWPPGHAGTP